MRAILILLAIMTTLLAPHAPQARAQSLPTDPRLVTGTLDNGFSYIILNHPNPPGRASAYMHISSGSLNETDPQRGIAHYLEHMAFNGSANFKPGDVIPFFQSLGLTFGRHQNAFTSFDQTTYQLQLPDNKPETLDKAFLFFSDVAFRLSLLPEQIDEERGIILEEKRTRISAQQRTGEYILARLAPGSTFGDRIPIGTEETILAVKEQDFRDYYSRWYTASNMTLIVVADMDPALVEASIRKHFSDAPLVPRPQDRPIGVTPQTESRAIVATDDELTQATVTIARIGPARAPATDIKAFRDDLAERLAFECFNRRLEKKIDAGKLKMLRGSAGAGNQARAIRQTAARASGKPSDWKVMLQDLALEVRRASAHGFKAWEVEDARKEILAGLLQASQRESTLPASAILGAMNARIAAGEPIMAAQQRYDLAEKILPTIEPQELTWIFSAAFDPAALTFIAEMPRSIIDGPPAPSEAELVEVGRQAMSITPAAEDQPRLDKPLLEKEPTPGSIAEQSLHEASGVTSAWLSNGVRVHHRFMDYFKNDVRINVTLAGGELLESDANRGVSRAAATAWTTPATRRLSPTEISDLMVGAKITVSGVAGQDVMNMVITGNPADLDRGLQLAHALLTEPKVEQAPLDKLKTNMIQAIRANKLDPTGRFSQVLADTVYPPGDPRPRFPTEEHVQRLNAPEAQAWLDQRIKESPIEVTIIGDIPLDRALDLAARYFGSLPERPRIGPGLFTAQRTLPAPTAPREQTIDLPTQSAKSMVMCGFGGPDAADLKDVRLMTMAAKILTTRMVKEVREEAQLVYSINANCSPGEIYPGYGLFFTAAPTDPQKVDRLVEKLESMFDTFAKDGPTDDEVTVAKKQQANLLDESMKTPPFWSSQVSALTYRGRNLDDVLAGPAAYESMTASEIREAFTRYHTPNSRIRAVLRSQPVNTTPPTPPGQ
ncbi:MAG: insulinase family protein [Phycisphaerales bacterium]|nr:insulinase family protein [Phycisphaerales bacterium]